MALVIQGASIRMPPANPITPQATLSQRKNAPIPKRKPAGNPVTAGFTFVDQSADLRSIADKKIVDSDQRHLIRSHVMQKVRKDERLQGKKRPTGRDGPRKPTMLQSASNATTPTSDSTSPCDSPYSVQAQHDQGRISPVSLAHSSDIAQAQQLVRVLPSPSQGRLDPFNTLPGGPELAFAISDLTAYCFHTFIPMTFPVEACSPMEYDMWRIKVLQSQSGNSATFFGLMAIVAAHRAIKNGRHKDLRPSPPGQRTADLLIDSDFGVMKSQALVATQKRIARNGWDGPTVEAIFSLIGAEQILGNFEEAHTHLTALKKIFVDGQGLDPKGPVSTWIPLTDVKGAIGNMSRPLFRLPWNPSPMPQTLMDKLYTWPAPEISALGSGFGYVAGLGPQMQAILQEAAVLFRFCQFNALCSHSVTTQEYEIFRRKNLELEYDVLSYIYPGSPTDDDQTPDAIDDIEQIARVAILGMTSSIITKVLPSAGVGRALTHHQNVAMQKYYTTSLPSRFTARFILWALMIFAQCAYRQPEERHFINSIMHYSQLAEIDDWVTLESEIWSKACSFRQLENKVQMTLPSRSQPQPTSFRPQNHMNHP